MYGSRLPLSFGDGMAVALHAQKLTFEHPKTGNETTVEAEIPKLWKSRYAQFCFEWQCRVVSMQGVLYRCFMRFWREVNRSRPSQSLISRKNLQSCMSDLVESGKKYIQVILKMYHYILFSFYLNYHASKTFPDSTLSSSGN